jgi:hypothetical protein
MPGGVPYNTESAQHEGFIVKPDVALCDVKKTYKCPLNNSCNVKWNEGTSSYICECHGDEFDLSGQVIKGPSIDNLKC